MRLYRKPIAEIATLHKAAATWTNRTLNADETLQLAPSGDLFHIGAQVSIPPGSRLKFNLRGVPVVCLAETVTCGPSTGVTSSQISTVEILLDRASIETYVNDGEVSITRYVLPQQTGLILSAEGGLVTIRSLNVYPLNSAWTAASIAELPSSMEKSASR